MEMDFKQLAAAIRVIAEEKNLPEEQVSEIVEQALAAAWRRDFGEREQEVRISMNLNTGEVTAFVTKEVAGEVNDPRPPIRLDEAPNLNTKATVGTTVELPH